MPRSVMADGIIVIQVEEGGESCISSIIRKRAGHPMMCCLIDLPPSARGLPLGGCDAPPCLDFSMHAMQK
jgi:hypothetical protein